MKHKKIYEDFSIEWVSCLDCGHEYPTETSIDDTKGCPICGSHLYEKPGEDYNDWGE